MQVVLQLEVGGLRPVCSRDMPLTRFRLVPEEATHADAANPSPIVGNEPPVFGDFAGRRLVLGYQTTVIGVKSQ